MDNFGLMALMKALKSPKSICLGLGRDLNNRIWCPVDRLTISFSNIGIQCLATQFLWAQFLFHVHWGRLYWAIHPSVSLMRGWSAVELRVNTESIYWVVKSLSSDSNSSCVLSSLFLGLGFIKRNSFKLLYRRRLILLLLLFFRKSSNLIQNLFSVILNRWLIMKSFQLFFVSFYTFFIYNFMKKHVIVISG